MTDSKYSAEEIERERRKQTSRASNVDQEKLQLQRDTMEIISTGTIEQLEEKLERLGIAHGTPKHRELIARFVALRGDLRR